KAETYFNLDDYMDINNLEISHHVNQALHANYIMKNNVDYIVQDGKIKIVDTFTGRIMEGKRYNQGLHQAIEAKENVEIMNESKTFATITYQNFFKMYNKISGMTGTAKTEEEEFKAIYKMKVKCIPTNKPIQRIDNKDVVYKNLKIKTKALIEEIRKRYEKGQPVLVGTTSIKSSEYISKELSKENIPHQILNAKYHEKEAAIIAQAGRYKTITIATNMAGRGTDILLGGNAEFLAKQNLINLGYTHEEIKLLDKNENNNSNEEYSNEFVIKINEDYAKELDKELANCLEDNKKVLEAGGLCILGTERHESRRIDDQLRGRSGRQGDKGESKFFISLEDDLIRIFGGDKIHDIIDKMGMDENLPLESSILANSIRNAQKKVESSNFSIRKYLLEYDNVINIQREIMYKERDNILFADNMNEKFYKIINLYVDELIDIYLGNNNKNIKNNIEELISEFILTIPRENIDDEYLNTIKDIKTLKEYLLCIIKKLYENREIELKDDNFNELVRTILLSTIDMYWVNHIEDMEILKQGINLRSVGQQDPKQVYAIEGSKKFYDMNRLIRKEIINRICLQ
ncbi:MAG: preprotein translocase subunit SecA, partial [Romboutsia sp.]|nr:preprotein translocase subunit SecA [Romboutsia sp.]